MGCREIKQHQNKVTSSCPNEAKHRDGYDRHPSFAVLIGDTPMSSCLACKLKEPFTDTVLRFQFTTKTPMGIFMLLLLRDEEFSHSPDGMLDRLNLIRQSGFDQPGRGTLKQLKNTSSRTRKRTTLFSLDDITYSVLDESVYAPYRSSVPNYALDRGLTLDVCREWELGHDRKMKRLLFPARNYKGELVGITGRLYDPNPQCPRHHENVNGKCSAIDCRWSIPPKYLHSHNVDSRGWRNLILYGEHKINHSIRRGILVEGGFDVLKLWQNGAINPVASLGTNVGDVQLSKLRTWFDELVVWGDSDPAGEEMEFNVGIRFIQLGGKTIRLINKPSEDPGDLDDDKLKLVLAENGLSIDKCHNDVNNNIK